MIKWSRELYMDPQISKNPDKWKKKLAKPGSRLYCICLSQNPENLLEIYDTRELWFGYARKYGLYVVGLAKNRDEAGYLIEDMMEDIYRKTGGCNVRSFFTFQE